MRVFLDHNVPVSIRKHLPGHLVMTARALGWTAIPDGDLISAAERAGYEVFLSGDKNIEHQQNLSGLKLALLILSRIDGPGLAEHVALVRQAIDNAVLGTLQHVSLPPKRKPARR